MDMGGGARKREVRGHLGRKELGRSSPDEEWQLWRRVSARVGEEDGIQFLGGCNMKSSGGKCKSLGTHFDTKGRGEAHRIQRGRRGEHSGRRGR